MSPHQSTTRSTPPPTRPTAPSTTGGTAGDVAAVSALIAPPAPAAEVLHLLRLLAASGPRERALLEALSAALRHRDLLAHPDVSAARHNATAPIHRLPTDDLPALAGRARTRGRTPDAGDDLDDLDDLVDWPATVAAAAQEVQDRLRDVEDAYRRPWRPAQRP